MSRVLNRRLACALKAVKDAEKKLEEVRLRLQARCKHPIEHCVEASYFNLGSGTSFPPFRVCKRCGYAEEGWYVGYQFLHRQVYEGIKRVSRDEARKFSIGKIHGPGEAMDAREGKVSMREFLQGNYKEQ